MKGFPLVFLPSFTWGFQSGSRASLVPQTYGLLSPHWKHMCCAVVHRAESVATASRDAASLALRRNATHASDPFYHEAWLSVVAATPWLLRTSTCPSR